MKLIKGGGEEDSDWGLEKTGYKKKGFYTASTDGRGHYDSIKALKIPQGVLGRISAVVAEVSQYRTPHDFVRDAIIHHLYEMAERVKDNQVAEYLDILAVEESIARQMEEVERAEEFVDKLEERLERAKRVKSKRLYDTVYDGALAVGRSGDIPDAIAGRILDILGRNQWS